MDRSHEVRVTCGPCCPAKKHRRIIAPRQLGNNGAIISRFRGFLSPQELSLKKPCSVLELTLTEIRST